MSRVYSIKCPNCAAPLKLIGGGRVETVTCEYCHSVIDLNDNYKILYRFRNVKVPKVPFKIGMQGKIEGVEWTIIGWIVYREEEDRDSKWSEFLLFSPLYGYAWLIYEDGVISFSRRVRDLDLRVWQKGNKRSIFYNETHYFLEDGESYRTVIDFVQGELTWIAKRGDKIECWDYRADSKNSITIEQSYDELEVYLTKRLNAREVYSSFSVDEKEQIIKKPTAIERLNEELETKKPPSFYGIVAIFIFLLATIIYSGANRIILSESFNKSGTSIFRVTSSAFLTEIEIKADSHKALNDYSLTVERGGKKIFYIDSGKVYDSKKRLNSSWSNSAIGAKIYLKLNTGQYLLKVRKLDPLSTSRIYVKVEDRVIRLDYIAPLFVIILIFLIMAFFSKRVSHLFLIAIGLIILWSLSPFLFLLSLIIFWFYKAKKNG